MNTCMQPRSDRRPASIEMRRQEKEKESGVPVSCSWALGKLYELLPRKRKPPGTNAESTAHRGEHRSRNSGDRAAWETGPEYGQGRHTEERTGHGTRRDPGGMLKKTLRKSASEGDDPPRFLATQAAAGRRDCRWRLATGSSF